MCQACHSNYILCRRLMGLPGVRDFDDLLGKNDAAKKQKGAMKGGAAATSRAGAIRQVTTTHLGDGQPLMLSMQVGSDLVCAQLIHAPCLAASVWKCASVCV